jgi:phosphoserine phosphatase
VKPDEKQLEQAGLSQSAPGVWTRGPADGLLERVARADIFVSDLDECMFPAITQGEAARSVIRRVASGPDVSNRLPLFMNMLFHAGVILVQQRIQEITGDIQNSRLIRSFENLARGVPLSYFEDAADELRDTYFTSVPETFSLFSSRGVRCGVISIGLDIVIRRLLSHLETTKGLKFEFFDCTHVRADSKGRFAGYLPEKTYTENDAKRQLLSARCEQYGSRMCVVIGHDKDDMKMFEEARRRGGVAIGFRPVPENYPLLDAAVFGSDWRPLFGFLSGAFENME